jgi:[ribosomal protein S5]-alanine N-acetyltransferase
LCPAIGFFSMQPLQSERLDLRPCCPSDIDALHALWTDPKVRQYLWDDVVINRDQAAEVVQAFLESATARGFGLWMLYANAGQGIAGQASSGTPDGKTLLGFCSLREIPGTPEVELLYGLAPHAWGQGLATEAARVVLQYGFDLLKLDRIWTRTDPPNIGSQRVIQRLGMRPADDPGNENPHTLAYVIEADRF